MVESKQLLALALALALVPVSLVALAMFGSGEARWDSYVLGSLVVAGACAWLASATRGARHGTAARVLWTLALPFVAGAATGFWLALLHPKRGLLEGLPGGMMIGCIGAILFYPALLAGAAVVQLWANWLTDRVAPSGSSRNAPRVSARS